ncbi:hypothetical protein ACLKA6_003234 [Drosophila palustris]
MRLFKTRKSTDTYSTLSAVQQQQQQQELCKSSNICHSNNISRPQQKSHALAICSNKLSKSIANSTAISSSLPDLHDKSPVMILSCTTLTSNGGASATAAAATSAAAAAATGNNVQQPLRTATPTCLLSGRQTPSAISMLSLQETSNNLHRQQQQQHQQQQPTIYVPNKLGNNVNNAGTATFLLSYASNSNIAGAQQQNQQQQHYQQYMAQRLHPNATSASNSCLYDKSGGSNISLTPGK